MGLREDGKPSAGFGDVLRGFLRVVLAIVVILAVLIIVSDTLKR